MGKPNSCLLVVVLGGLVAVWSAGAAEEGRTNQIDSINQREDGTYVLATDDPRSIQAYYSDVGMGRLVLADRSDEADMRETCFALGANWRPLGHVQLPDGGSERSYRLDLCYYTGPNPDDMARAKCANLGLVLRTNRGQERRIVCEPRRGSRVGA